MPMVFENAFKLGLKKWPKGCRKSIEYGTAGFRTKHTELPHVMFRMGLLSVLRSKERKATIGVMITASHNPEEDNGVKLIDPMGEMLEASWEYFATFLANIDDNDLCMALERIANEAKIDLDVSAQVYIAHDTRFSSPQLSTAVKDGVEVLQGKYKDFELLTTPQLHYMVCCYNSERKYGEDTEEGYYKKLSNAFLQLKKCYGESKKYTPYIKLDGANGVGAVKVKCLQQYLGDSLKISLYNDGSKGKLNHMCGADFVKVIQKEPQDLPLECGEKGVSYDGDADRIVYFYLDTERKFHLLDGDKIAILVADYLQNLLKSTDLNLKLCIVQTAYANGSSTKYIVDKLNIQVACVPTGVKHLHHRAQEENIGIYFEANGHGTVLFNEVATRKIEELAGNSNDIERQLAAKKLLHIINIINQTTGDAISDMLLIEAILSAYDWDITTWNNLYKDLPNRQLKVKVADRTVISTTDAERKCTKPSGLQNAIDYLTKKYESSRSFVRPSGTEDIVRIYAEAKTQEEADFLAYEVAVLVYEMAGGTGEMPKPPN